MVTFPIYDFFSRERKGTGPRWIKRWGLHRLVMNKFHWLENAHWCLKTSHRVLLDLPSYTSTPLITFLWNRNVCPSGPKFKVGSRLCISERPVRGVRASRNRKRWHFTPTTPNDGDPDDTPHVLYWTHGECHPLPHADTSLKGRKLKYRDDGYTGHPRRRVESAKRRTWVSRTGNDCTDSLCRRKNGKTPIKTDRRSPLLTIKNPQLSLVPIYCSHSVETLGISLSPLVGLPSSTRTRRLCPETRKQVRQEVGTTEDRGHVFKGIVGTLPQKLHLTFYVRNLLRLGGTGPKKRSHSESKEIDILLLSQEKG